MSKFLSLVFLAVLLAAPAYARRNREPQLLDNRAYVFYLRGCPICREALKHIDNAYHNRPDIIRVDMETKEGRALLKACAKKFGVQSIVAPMVCIGDNHFMGWSTKAARDFDAYVRAMYPQ